MRVSKLIEEGDLWCYGRNFGLKPLYTTSKKLYHKSTRVKGEIIKFVCVAMHSLVMILHSRDIPWPSIDIIIQNNTIHCRLNHTVPGF